MPKPSTIRANETRSRTKIKAEFFDKMNAERMKRVAAQVDKDDERPEYGIVARAMVNHPLCNAMPKMKWVPRSEWWDVYFDHPHARPIDAYVARAALEFVCSFSCMLFLRSNSEFCADLKDIEQARDQILRLQAAGLWK